MEEKIIKTIIQFRRDTEANWLVNKDLVLKEGEPAVVLDGENKGKIKIGDGVTTWENLPFASGDSSEVIVEVESVKEDVETVKSDVDTVKSDIENVKSDAETVKTEVSEVKTEVVNLQELTTNHTTQITEVTNNVTNLQNIVTGQATDISSLQALVATKVNADEVYKKDEVYNRQETDSKINDLIGEKIVGVYRFKGHVDNYSELPIEGNEVGDVWNIKNADSVNGINAGDNVAWDGAEWDELAGIVDLSNYVSLTDFNEFKITVDDKIEVINSKVTEIEAKVNAVPSNILQSIVGVDYSDDKAVFNLVTGVKQEDGSYSEEPVELELGVATRKNAGLLSAVDKLSIDSMGSVYSKNKYEITSVPVGTLVDYRDKEIRIMAPADTVWKKQNVGSTGNANMYYVPFKAYAPDGAVGFKEGMQGVVDDEYFDFSGSFAGTDEFGRNYSIVWLSLASYDETSDTWTYFGENSTINKYIGWTYVVEWYDANGIVISRDKIRISLANEDCYDEIRPYYMANTLQGITLNSNAVQAVNGVVDIPVAKAGLLGLVQPSEEILVGEDGKLSIGQIPVSKLIDDGTTLILDGGNSQK